MIKQGAMTMLITTHNSATVWAADQGILGFGWEVGEAFSTQ